MIEKQTILSIMDYGCIVRGDCEKQNALHLKRLQNQKQSNAHYPQGKSQELYTIHVIETNAAAFK